MKVNLRIGLVMLTILLLGVGAGADPAAKNPLEQMGFPAFPGTNLITEINLPAGRLLDQLTKEVGPWLGLEELRELNLLVFGLDSPKSAQEVYAFYEHTIESQEWKTMVRSFAKDAALAVLFKEDEGMLIINVDPLGKPNREIAVIRAVGRIDPEKIGNPEQKLPDIFGKVAESAEGASAGREVQAASGIPIGQPISVPPSEKLHLKATRSEIRAQVLDQNTAEIRLASRVDDPGELVRIDERLVLALTPKLVVDEVILPGNVPILLEVTEGSLAVSSGDRLAKLSIVSTGAPVVVDSMPLVSGTHMVKALGSSVQITLSAVQGGVLEIEATGGDVTLALPIDASAVLDVTAAGGTIDNRTGVEPQEMGADHIKLQMGAGKAAISLKAVGGAVCIRIAG